MSRLRYAGLLAFMTLLPWMAACSHAPFQQQPKTTVAPSNAKAVELSKSPAKPEQSAEVPVDVLSAQKALAELGYDVGKADGLVGPATRAAVESFQKDQALSPDGKLSASLLRLLTERVAQLPKSTTVTAKAGDIIVYADGTVDNSDNERAVQWDSDADRSVVALRPSTRGWPQAARAGLDWAVSHALDNHNATSFQWSSTGVSQKFEIHVLPGLSPGETKLAGAASCRRFDLREMDSSTRYPGLACKDTKGWYIPHSSIRIARPATALHISSPKTADVR